MELVDGDGFPRPEQQTVPIRRQALVPESLEAIRPISSPKQSACHGPELSLFTLQRLLQVEKPATLGNPAVTAWRTRSRMEVFSLSAWAYSSG